MCSGRELKKRIELSPDAPDIHNYGNQRHNFNEIQKLMVRKHVQENNKKNYYTYSREYLGAAFPVVDPQHQAQAEIRAREAKFKTPQGFDTLMKREDWNKLSKKPTEAALEAL
jgi:hypothetical protein